MMMTSLLVLPPFPNVVEALAYWAERDQAPLRGAVVPPCDFLDDEVYDAMLAVFFRHAAEARTPLGRRACLDMPATIYERQIAQLRTVAAEHRVEADANIARIERMVAVIRKWDGEIADAAAQAAVEGRLARAG